MNRWPFLIGILLVACSEPTPEIQDLRTDEVTETTVTDEKIDEQPTPILDSAVVEATSKYTYQLVEGAHGWGYQIFEGSSMRINQQHIPSLPGVRGFNSQEHARKTAEYVIEQMEKGTPLPTLSKDILDSLGVL